MKILTKLLMIALCFLLAGCSSVGHADPSASETFGSDFIFKSSISPVSMHNNDEQNVDEQHTVIKYDEIKAVWLSYIDLAPMLTGKTEQEFSESFENACKNICELGCNTIFVHVRPFGDALYRSEMYPASKHITGVAGKQGDFDPLTIMTRIAHSYKLSIHGWINPLRLESEDCFAAYDNSYQTKKWFDSKNGRVCAVDGDRHLWLNPGYSEVRQFIADGAAEIIKKYDVDGIHFDDYFYPTTDESFDKACFADNSQSKNLSVWRLDNISDMVSRIYKAVKSVDERLVVGVSPQGNVDNNYRYMYADVKKWGSEKGYVDYICPQIYFGYNNPVKPFLSTLEEWEKIVTEQNVDLNVGLAVYKIDGGESEFVQTKGIIASQIQDIYKSDKCKGFSLYSYSCLFAQNERSSCELDSIKRLLNSK